MSVLTSYELLGLVEVFALLQLQEFEQRLGGELGARLRFETLRTL